MFLKDVSIVSKNDGLITGDNMQGNGTKILDVEGLDPDGETQASGVVDLNSLLGVYPLVSKEPKTIKGVYSFCSTLGFLFSVIVKTINIVSQSFFLHLGSWDSKLAGKLEF